MRGGITDSHGNSAMGPAGTGWNYPASNDPWVGVNSTIWRTRIGNVDNIFAVVEFDSNRVIPESLDVRPRNVALLACIKF